MPFKKSLLQKSFLVFALVICASQTYSTQDSAPLLYVTHIEPQKDHLDRENRHLRIRIAFAYRIPRELKSEQLKLVVPESLLVAPESLEWLPLDLRQHRIDASLCRTTLCKGYVDVEWVIPETPDWKAFASQISSKSIIYASNHKDAFLHLQLAQMDDTVIASATTAAYLKVD